MSAVWLLLSYFFFRGTLQANGQLYDHLYKTLLNNAMPTIPMVSVDMPITVKMNLNPIEIIEINEQEMYIDITAWVFLTWKDTRLAWDREIYEVGDSTISQDLIWKPDIVLFNSQSTQFTVPGSSVQSVVNYTGDVMTVNPTRFRSSCFSNSSDQSTIVCKLKFGSWVYSGRKLNLETLTEGRLVDLSNYEENPKWRLEEAEVQRNEDVYDCCPETYPSLTFTLRFRKIGD